MKHIFLIAVALLIMPSTLQANSDWLTMSGKDTVIDTHTKLMWQYGKSRKSFRSEDAAQKYVKSLHLGGFNDWRLPTLAERWDMVQVFMYKENGDVNFPKPERQYWTRETDKGTIALKLDYSCMCRGDQEVEYKPKGYVRAVRGPIQSDKK